VPVRRERRGTTFQLNRHFMRGENLEKSFLNKKVQRGRGKADQVKKNAILKILPCPQAPKRKRLPTGGVPNKEEWSLNF